MKYILVKGDEFVTAEAHRPIGRKGERTKRKLLESAAQLFARHDFDGVTVEDIRRVII